jgi:hypothetical protein
MASGNWMDSVKAKFGLDMTKFEAGLKSGAKSFAKFGSQIGLAIVMFEPLKKTIQGTADAISLAGVAMQGLAVISTQTAAKNQVLGTVMSSVAHNMAITANAADQAAKAIKRKGVTTEEARQSTIQFMQSELKLADASNLARAAQDLAVAANMNSSDAMNTLMASVTSLEPMLLRQFGLTKNMTDIQTVYAIKLNKSVESMTSVERKQAIMNYILTEAKKVTGNYEMAMDDAGKKVTSFARLIEEFRNDVGQAGLKVYKPIIDNSYNFLKVLNELPEPMKKVVGAVVILGSGLGTLVGPLTGIGFKLAEIGGLIQILGILWTAGGVVFAKVAALVGGVVSASFAGLIAMIKVAAVEAKFLWAAFTDGIFTEGLLDITTEKLSATYAKHAAVVSAETGILKTNWMAGTLATFVEEGMAKAKEKNAIATWGVTIAGVKYNAAQLVGNGIMTAGKLIWQQFGMVIGFVKLGFQELGKKISEVWKAMTAGSALTMGVRAGMLQMIASFSTASSSVFAFITGQKALAWQYDDVTRKIVLKTVAQVAEAKVIDMTMHKTSLFSKKIITAGTATSMFALRVNQASQWIVASLIRIGGALTWLAAHPYLILAAAAVALFSAVSKARKEEEMANREYERKSSIMAEVTKMQKDYINEVLKSATVNKTAMKELEVANEKRIKASKGLIESQKKDKKEQESWTNMFKFKAPDPEGSQRTKDAVKTLEAEEKLTAEKSKQVLLTDRGWMKEALKYNATLDEAKEKLIKIKQAYQDTEETIQKQEEDLARVNQKYLGWFERMGDMWIRGKSWSKQEIALTEYRIQQEKKKKDAALAVQAVQAQVVADMEKANAVLDQANYDYEKSTKLYELGLAPQEEMIRLKEEEYRLAEENVSQLGKEGLRRVEGLKLEVMSLKNKQMEMTWGKQRAKLQNEINLGIKSERENLAQTRKEVEQIDKLNISDEEKAKKKRQLSEEEKANMLLNYQLDIDLNKYKFDINVKSEKDMREYELSKLKNKLATVKTLTLKEKMELNQEIKRKEVEMADFTIQQIEKTNAHIANLNQSDVRKQYVLEMQTFEARKKAGLLVGEKLLEEQRKMEQRARDVRQFDAQKSEERFMRWKQAADLGYFNSKLLLENGGMKFTTTKYTEHYKEILAKHREMTEGIDQKEREQVTQYSKDMSKVYAEMGRYYAVSSDGTVKANDLILRTFRKSIYTTERELWFFQQNMGVKRVEAEQTKNDLLISSIASQLRKGDGLVGKERAKWEKKSVKQIEEYKDALKRQDELHAELIRKKAEREQALADRRLSIEKRMQKFLEDQSMNETEKQKRQLEEDAAEAIAAGADKLMTDKYLNAQINKIQKEGKEREKEENEKLMQSNKELANSNNELGQSFEDLGDSMNGTKDKGDKWYKTISDFAGIGSSKTAPMFKAMNNLSSGMGKAVDMFGVGMTGAKGSENAMAMFRPDRMSVYGDNANSFMTERVMGGMTAKDMMAKASGQTIGAEERRKEEINKAAAMLGIYTGSVDPTAPTQVGGVARAEKTTEEKQKQQGTFNSESYDAGVDKIVAAIKEAKGAPAKVAGNPALVTNYNQHRKSGAETAEPGKHWSQYDKY